MSGHHHRQECKLLIMATLESLLVEALGSFDETSPTPIPPQLPLLPAAHPTPIPSTTSSSKMRQCPVPGNFEGGKLTVSYISDFLGNTVHFYHLRAAEGQ